MDRADVMPSPNVAGRHEKTANSEPIPGYRLLQPLGRGGFGEVWKCEVPGGLFKAIKFVYGNAHSLEDADAPADAELQAVERIKTLRHPFLLSMDRVELIHTELVIVMELADKNLQDLLDDYRRAGRRGIPRDELLGYLLEAAEVLDLMNSQYGLQHLDIKPRNLFLVCNHVKVGDFGLVNSAVNGANRPPVQLGAITPLYAPPEVFLGSVSPYSDQYSLAIVYQELLTGTLPFTGKNSRQLLVQHTTGEPNLDPLPEEDRVVVARALSKDPLHRYRSCTDFVRALRENVVTGRERLPVSGGALGVGSNPDIEHSLRETAPNTLRGTERHRRITPGPASEALAGYRLLERASCDPLTEIWKAQDPDGAPVYVHFIYGYGPRDEELAEQAVERLRALHHSGLQSFDLVTREPGRLIVVTDPATRSLRERMQECLAQGQPGIPRRELLGILREAALTIDALGKLHGLPHGGLHPRCVLLKGKRVLLAGYGVAPALWLPAGSAPPPRQARYAAPEVLTGQCFDRSDVYSLALIFVEMATGVLVRGTRFSETNGAPARRSGLEDLPPSERRVLWQALDPDPEKRQASCLELIQGILAATERAERELAVDAVAEAPPDQTPMPIAALSSSPLGDLLSALRNGSDGAGATHNDDPDHALKLDCLSPLPRGTIRTRIETLFAEWHARILRTSENAWLAEVRATTAGWRRWLRRAPGLQVAIMLSRPDSTANGSTGIAARVTANGTHGERLLKELGPRLLDDLSTRLDVAPDRRMRDRLLWEHPLQVRFLLPDGRVGEPATARGKDLSLTGIGFYLPDEIPSAQITISLPTPFLQPPSITLPATIVRAKRREDGWYEIGARFQVATIDA